MELTGVSKLRHKAKGCLNLISLTCSMLLMNASDKSVSNRLKRIKSTTYELDKLIKQFTSESEEPIIE